MGGRANQIAESTGSAGWCVSAAAARRQPVAGWRVQVTMMAMMEQPWRPMLANYLLMNYSCNSTSLLGTVLIYVSSATN